MRNVRMKPVFLGMLLFASAVVAFAPSASAQTEQASTISLKLSTIDSEIQPLVDTKEIKGDIEFNYFTSGCAALSPIEIKLAVAKAPSWAGVVLSPTSVFVQPKGGNCGQASTQKDTQSFKAQVYVSADAPAFQQEEIQISATSVAFQGGKSASAIAGTPIRAGYYSILEARVDQPIIIARPQETVNFPIVVSNFGNGLTKVSFTVKSSDETKLIPSQIQAVTIESRLSGKSNTAPVTLTAITPYHNGYLNEVASLTVDIAGVYANNPKYAGDHLTLNTIVTTKGFYVPGPDLTMSLLGVAVVAGIVGARLRRRAD